MLKTMIGILAVLALTACTKEQATDELDTVKKANEAAAAASAHANIAAVDPIGVPECDSYLEHYESCLTEKVPAQKQQGYRTQLEMQRNEWRRAAGDPAMKDGLPQQCKDAATLAKDTFSSYGCDF